MAKRILFLGFLIAISAFAHGAPSVWDQMQHGSVNSAQGLVKAVDVVGSEIYVKIETQSGLGDKSLKTERLCTQRDGYDAVETDIMAATLLKARLDILNEARRLGKPIEYGTTGVWKSCVSFLRQVEG